MTIKKRVLDELQDHLEDAKLHIVAAPGSGKTVLGLEIMRELGKPALILSPTLTIRNQWTERLFEMFLDRAVIDQEEISYDLNDPKIMTCSTYQALHALWKYETQKGEKQHRPKFAQLVESLTHRNRADHYRR